MFSSSFSLETEEAAVDNCLVRVDTCPRLKSKERMNVGGLEAAVDEVDICPVLRRFFWRSKKKKKQKQEAAG